MTDIPGCSTCGFAVEWLRSAYKCRRKLFRNSDVELGGRYYFAPEGTAHYRGVHLLGSLNWTRGEDEHSPTLGEVPGSRAYYLGTAPDRLPIPMQLGDAACLADGATYPPGAIDRTIIDGIDSRCFQKLPLEVVPPPPPTFAVDAPALQAALARMIELTYAGDFTTVKTAINQWVGPIIDSWRFAASGVLPERQYYDTKFGVIVLLSGTSTFQQFATQAFQSLIGPIPVGPWNSLPAWNYLATQVITELSDVGVSHTRPIMLVGHSYGAAAAALVAARYRIATPTRDLNLVTFGMPKIGDRAARDAVAAIRAVHVANDNDLVPALPPALLEVLPFFAVLPAGVIDALARWEHQPAYLMLAADNTTSVGVPPFITAGPLNVMITAILLGNPIAPIAGHPIEVYRARLKLRQPNPAWPMNADAWATLFP